MNEIVLTGCDESHFPISTMAAFGVLRLLSLMTSTQAVSSDPVGECPKLSWQSHPRWTAVLRTCLTRTQVVQALADAAERATKAPVWIAHSDLKKVTPEAYRELLQAYDHGYDKDLAASMACEWPVTEGGKLNFTPFFMTSGRQQWCKIICDAAAQSMRSKAGTTDMIEEALFGPWRYAHELSGAWVGSCGRTSVRAGS